MRLLLLSIIIAFCFTANATTYYISANGNDANNGTSASASWRTLSKLNSFFSSLKPGDNVLFNRGDIFYGNIVINQSGSTSNPITIGAYGSGSNPVITGFTTVAAWTNKGSNIWESTNTVSTLSSCNMVVINGINTAMGRTPNYPNYYTWNSHTGTSITGTLTGSPDWTGAEAAVFNTSYTNIRHKISSQSGGVLNWTDGSESLWQNSPGYFFQQYHIQNDIRTLDVQNEWYYNNSTKKIDIYSTNSPAPVQMATVDNLINVGNQSSITIRDITLTGSNGDAISIGTSNDIKIINCNINHIGVTGIYAITSGTYKTGLVIDSNSITYCNNAGIDLKYWYSAPRITNNNIDDIRMLMGMESSAHTISGGGAGITCQSDNGIVSYNRVDSCGVIGISYIGSGIQIDHNYVTNTCIGNGIRDEGAIYTWNGSYRAITSPMKIFNNIVLTTGSYSEGFYCDENSNNAEIYNNFAYDVLRGIQLNDSHEMNVHDNTTFNTGRAGIGAGLFLNNNTGSPKLRNITVKNNKFVAKTTADRSLWVITTDSLSMPKPFISDYNYFAKPIADNVNNIYTVMQGQSYLQRTLANWQVLNGQDAHSKQSPKAITDTLDFNFQYNATNSPVTIPLPYNYMDITGATYNGIITLQPYTSAVLIKNGPILNNKPPKANAGPDQTITLPTSLALLTGSGSDSDGVISSYNWTKISGPSGGTIINTTSANTGINGLVQGVYLIELKVTDNGGATGKDTIKITVNPAPNVPPLADAGSDQTITLPTNNVSLQGYGTDVDGTIASYSWTKISGPSAYTIANASSSLTNVTGLAQGTYKFELKVTDNSGASTRDTMQVIVNPAPNIPPVANAGTAQIITLPINTVTFSGSGSDADGTIAAYQWTKISGPVSFNIISALSANTNITGLTSGVYQFQLTVTDDKGATGTDIVQVTVNAAVNIPPVSNAGIDQSLTLPINTVTLSGSGMDADGTIASYLWTKISGPSSFTIVNASSATTDVTGLIEGVYQFQLSVTDNNGATAIDVIQIIVNAAVNLPPVSNAGPNQSIVLPTNIVTLSGSGSDADGTVVNYQWIKISGPSSFNIVNSSSPVTDVSGLVRGTYQFELKVTDNSGAIGTDIIQIKVNNGTNNPPVSNAGADQSITLPVNTVTLSGSGIDTDGTIAGYEWTEISGPSAYTIANATSASTGISGLVEGVYQFQLIVTDNKGATATDVVQVTVNASINIAPVSNAGADQSITLPTNTITLSGSGTDADGTIATYAWSELTGSPSLTIADTSSANTDITGLTEGIYQFQLTVKDNNGATAIDIVQVTVNAAANIPPAANAGADQTIQLPINSVTLQGSASDTDGTIAGYAWSQISGPAGFTIADASSANTNVTGLAEGVYQFQLQVTDNSGAIATDIIQVTLDAAVNIPPTADAGVDQNIILPTTSITLSGSGSDTDGTIASYIWSEISGPSGYTIADASSANTIVTGLTEGAYQFQLQVTDNNGAVATDIIQVIVNAANILPVANAGIDQTITLPDNTITLSGSGSDADGSIAGYEWTKISGPDNYIFTNEFSFNTDVTGLSTGVYQFQLKVTDNNGATATDILQITVNPGNLPPVANAGTDQTITLPVNAVTFTGTGTDTDGTIAGYLWTKISGPVTYTIANASSANTNIAGLVQGVYQFKLEVTDNNGAIAADTIQVIVNVANNIAPVANAGSDQTITLPVNSVTLNGSGTDADGTIAGYAWTKISGPSSYAIVNALSFSTSITGLVQGIYQFKLEVTDNSGAVATDIIQVTVNAPVNIAPVANAGADQTITLPANTITLSGSGTDTDGTIASYSWIKISGPSSYNITSASSAVINVTGLVQGVYKFRLKVTDNNGAIATAFVQVTVNAAVNIPPVANAGTDRVITLPTNTVSLTGSGSDADGTISNYLWTKISGPSAYAIANASSANTNISGLAEGTYQFQLQVTDNSGAIATGIMQVVVNAAANIPPIANAGTDKTIILPVNNIILAGSGTDADGTITSYNWTKISGSSSYTIVNPLAANANITGLAAGVYQFQLKVTDNAGATSSDVVQVTVNPALNIPPVANAGSDKNITLPVSTVTLSGSGSDADGTVTGYLWTKISGPSVYTISSTSSAVTNITGLTAGMYQFQLKVTDNNGATATDLVQVTVNAPINIPPAANAGADQSIILPANSILLSGSGSDADGTVTSYLWTKISGPSSYNIVSSSLVSTNITGLVEGVYQFQLKVTDNSDATATDVIQVTVNAAADIPPVISAGADQTINLPLNNVTLTGSGSDADGLIINYLWTKISGPSSYSITNASAAVTSITGLGLGVYQFQLTAIDNDGATSTDIMQVTVNAAVNVPPVAKAGSDQTITLPVNSVSLLGNGTDADGTIASYIWSKISGLSAYTIANASSAATNITGLSEGVYAFELKVTDNNGAIGTDVIQITVKAGINIPPVANAGTDQVITLPTNTVSLSGSGTDADGTVASYIWSKISGPSSYTITNVSLSNTNVTGLAQGTYKFELRVSDNRGAITRDTMQVTVNPAPNMPPLANAGANTSVVLPQNTVSLAGKGNDADGSVINYAWTKISGPSAYTIVNISSPVTDVTDLTEGVYKFELKVTDNKGATGTDTMEIIVIKANIIPIVNAGDDQTISIPTNSIELKGNAFDVDGSIKGYVWTKISGPETGDIANSKDTITAVNNLTGGTYQFELSAIDNDGGVGKDTVTIIVAEPRLNVSVQNSARIYPNPVADITTLEVNTKQAGTSVKFVISNVQGRVVSKGEMDAGQTSVKQQINMSNYAKGFYTVTVYFDNNQKQSIKVIKE